MNVLSYHDDAFYATPLSNGLVAENFQHSLSFCHDAARPSFNAFPEFFKANGYNHPRLEEPMVPTKPRMRLSFPSSNDWSQHHPTFNTSTPS